MKQPCTAVLCLHKGRIEVGIAAFSQTDLTYDLMKITALVPVMHGDDDLSPRCCRAVVSEADKERDAKDLQGLRARQPTTQVHSIDADLLAFIKS